MQFQKNPHPPHERSSEIPRGRGVLKAILEAKYESKLEFPGGGGGGGCKTKNLPVGEYGYFLELHNNSRIDPTLRDFQTVLLPRKFYGEYTVAMLQFKHKIIRTAVFQPQWIHGTNYRPVL